MKHLSLINLTANPGTVRNYSEHHTHEHRAPTDDSIRIYKEMEEKAQNSLLASFQLRSNTLECAWIVTEDPRTCDKVAKCKLVMNGQESKFEVPLPYGLRYLTEPKEIAKTIREKVIEHISAMLTIELFESAHGKFYR